MTPLIIIPARYASSRLPGKPLALIKDKPMIQHVYERVKTLFEHVYIATDDERIMFAAKKFSAPAVMTRSNHLSGTDRCCEALEIIEENTKLSFDIVINVQGDEPMIDPYSVQAAAALMQKENCQIGTLIKKIDNANALFDTNIPKVVLDKDFKALYFSRQTIPFLREKPTEQWLANHTYYKHIGLYVFRKDILKEITKLSVSSLEKAEKLEQNRWLEAGYSINCAVTEYESLSIDTKEDLERANLSIL